MQPDHLSFIKANRIEGVEYLKAGPDADLIKQAEAMFQQHSSYNYDGFEVWDGRRFVYRSQPFQQGEATSN